MSNLDAVMDTEEWPLPAHYQFETGEEAVDFLRDLTPDQAQRFMQAGRALTTPSANSLLGHYYDTAEGWVVGTDHLPDIEGYTAEQARENLELLAEHGYVTRLGDDRYELTEAGVERADLIMAGLNSQMGVIRRIDDEEHCLDGSHRMGRQ